MNYPLDAIEACEALSHPLPHPPDMHTRSIDVSHFAQHDHGAKVDTQHPGPIEMHEPDDYATATRRDILGIALVVGVLAGLLLVAVAGPLIENLPELMGATAK